MIEKSSELDYLSPELRQLVVEEEGVQWLFVGKLKAGDVLEIHTKHSKYEVQLSDPEHGIGTMTSTNRRMDIPELSECSVLGSTLSGTGSMLKVGGIAKDLRLCIWVRGIGELILSETQKVLLSKKRAEFLPDPTKRCHEIHRQKWNGCFA